MNDNFLNSEIVVTGRLVDASNATLFGHLKDDENYKIIYKPVAGERPLWDFPSGSLANREVAAYIFSELFDFNIVPRTVLREGPYGLGMVQEWKSNSQPDNLIDIGQSDHPDLRKMAIFDALINNGDRKYGHLLILENGQIQGCDHGVTFHEDDKLRTVLWQWAGERFFPDEIEVLQKCRTGLLGQLGETLKPLLTESEIKACISRIDRMLKEQSFPEPSPNWPAVPWPAF
jgi:uncharacterized repeat protein (TIGR03843 family)